MVATIIFNQNNVVTTDGNNNKLVYSFPSSASFPNHEIAIQNINLYYSWTNVNSTTLRNNTFYYAYPSTTLQAGVGAANTNNVRLGVPTYPAMPTGYTAFQVIIPNGLYEVADLNKYLQFIFIQNGHYYVNSSSQNVYFAEFVVNPSNYSIQLNTYPVLTTAQVTAAGGSLPLAANTLAPSVQNYGSPTNNNMAVYMYNPVSANSGSPTYGANDFNLLLGYAKGFGTFNTGTDGTTVPATATAQATNQSFQSSFTPEIQPNPVLYIAASNIENNYANPNTIIGTITPQVAFGDLISITPPQFSWNKLLAGTYQGLRISLLGSNFRDIQLLDPNITIVLALRNTKDNPALDLLNTAAGGK
jgi:hypothetical protein